MSDQLVVERQGLEKKDKAELQAIVAALGGSTTARMRKADLIDQILDLSGATARVGSQPSSDADGTATETTADEAGDEQAADAESASTSAARAEAESESDAEPASEAEAVNEPTKPNRNNGGRSNNGSGSKKGGSNRTRKGSAGHPTGPRW